MEAFESTEEAVLKVANALEEDIDSSSIEISHRIKRNRNDNVLIVTFVSHKDKTKARAKLKSVKMTSLFPNPPAVPPQKDRIFLNENLTDHRRYVLPIIAYTWRLRPKEVPFSDFRYING